MSRFSLSGIRSLQPFPRETVMSFSEIRPSLVRSGVVSRWLGFAVQRRSFHTEIAILMSRAAYVADPVPEGIGPSFGASQNEDFPNLESTSYRPCVVWKPFVLASSRRLVREALSLIPSSGIIGPTPAAQERAVGTATQSCGRDDIEVPRPSLRRCSS